MSEAIKTMELSNGGRIEINYSTGDSREWDNFAKLICFHNRYNLGDDHDYNSDDFSGWDEMRSAIIRKEDAAIILPLYLYDHSGITISTTPFSCPWDSGRVGFAVVSKKTIREEFGVKRVTKKQIERATSILLGEVKIYDMELTGEVFSFAEYDKDDNYVDGCGGFYGSNFEENGMLEHIQNEEAVELLKEEGSVY